MRVKIAEENKKRILNQSKNAPGGVWREVEPDRRTRLGGRSRVGDMASGGLRSSFILDIVGLRFERDCVIE